MTYGCRGTASWRDGSRPAIRAEIPNHITRGTFAAEFWTSPTPTSDRIVLHDPGLTLPPPGPDWRHTAPIDRVFKLGANGYGGWNKTQRWLNIKLSSRAQCCVYRASNA